MAFLIFSKNGPEDAFLLGDNQVIIGRATDCGLTIKSNMLSRKHCKIYPGKNVYIIEDLGSANGTLVNGKKITEATNLNQGDIIRIGDTVAHFSWHPNLEIKKEKSETKAISKEDKPIDYPMLKLVSAPKGVDLPKEFTLKTGSYNVGRKPGNDILINFKSVSGNHCKISVEADAIFIEDLGSTNGTKINGKKITEKTQISDGDEVQFEKLFYKVDWASKRVSKRVSKPDSIQDDLLFLDEEKKAPAKSEPADQKFDFIDDDDDNEIKLDDPDDISFDINFDDQATDDQRQQAMKMFEEIGHTDQINAAQSGTLEDQLKKEVQEFLDDGTKKKKSLKSYALIFLEIGFVLAAIIVALFLIMQEGSTPVDNEQNFNVPAPADSLITENWSFEKDVENSDQELKDWMLNIADSDYVYAEIADTVKSGRACLRIVRNDQTLRQSEVYYAHPIKVEGGLSYQLDYWVKNVQDSGAAVLKIAYFSDENGANENFLKNEIIGDCVRSTNQNWLEVVATTVAPTDAKSARISLTVFGGESVFQFDDVVMKTSAKSPQVPAEFVEIQAGMYNIRLDSMGMFSAYKDGGDKKDYVFEDLYCVLHHQKTATPVSLKYFTQNLAISKVAGRDDEIQCTGILLDPLGSQTGSGIPYVLSMKVADNSKLNFQIKFDKEIPYTYGITFSLTELDGENSTSIYNTTKGRSSVNYYSLPIRDYQNQPIEFDKIVMPLMNSFLGVQTMISASIQAEFVENKVSVVTKQEGSQSSYVLELNINESEISEINAMINEAVSSEKYTLAIAYLYKKLYLITHNPIEFRKIQDRINTLSSELLAKKEEFQGILSNLENNPSALLFSHAQVLGSELGIALKDQVFADLVLDFNAKYEINSESRYYVDECTNKINKLREITKLVSDFEEKYRGKIDYAYMLRAENKAQKLLARAYDYYSSEAENVDDYSMAISIFEQIVNLYPFTRPATVARNELVSIAFLLNQKADEISLDKKELANQYRTLAKGLCDKVLKPEFTTAGGEINNYWDNEGKTWTKIAEGIIASFYEVARTENTGNDDDVDDGIEEDFKSWTNETWKMKEAEARETIDAFIKQIELKITALPEPTEIPDSDSYDDDDDDDGSLLGDDDDDDENND